MVEKVLFLNKYEYFNNIFDENLSKNPLDVFRDSLLQIEFSFLRCLSRLETYREQTFFPLNK